MYFIIQDCQNLGNDIYMHIFAPNHVYMLVILQLESRHTTRQVLQDRLYFEQAIAVSVYEDNRSCDVRCRVSGDHLIISKEWDKLPVFHDLRPVHN
jgi:hypothetical protein